MTSITNSGLALSLVNALQSQQVVMAKLSQQVATGIKNVNLTDYAPPEAHNLLSYQNSITLRSSYISSMNTVDARLSMYDSSMSDMEKIAAQASTLATQNQTYNPDAIAGVESQINTYLQQLTSDFNQQVDGRYVYAGSRYSTPPVVNLTTVTGPYSATPTTSPTVPAYDANYTSTSNFTINSQPTGNFTIGNISIPWSQLATTSITPITVNGSSYNPTPAITGLTAGTTPSILAANLAATLNQLATQVPSGSGISTLTATATSGSVSMSFGASATPAITPASGGTAGQTTWNGGIDGTNAQNSLPSAFVRDTASVDVNFTVTYGLTSNDPSFQKLVNGLRFMNDAVIAGKAGNTATYQSNMQQASTLISSGLAGIQALHAGVANNQNIIKQQTDLQNADITTLKNQVADIQQVNLTELGSELNLLQTQLQASYSSTASLEKLSLLNYL